MTSQLLRQDDQLKADSEWIFKREVVSCNPQPQKLVRFGCLEG